MFLVNKIPMFDRTDKIFINQSYMKTNKFETSITYVQSTFLLINYVIPSDLINLFIKSIRSSIKRLQRFLSAYEIPIK